MRAGVLSDPEVIAEINRDFVVVEVDISKNKAPAELMPIFSPLRSRTISGYGLPAFGVASAQ